MNVCRAWAGMTAALSGLALAFAIGCSSEDEGPMDAGVSPFYPGPSEPLGPGSGPDLGARSSALPSPTASVPGQSLAGRSLQGSSSGLDGDDRPIRPEDVERNLRIAMLSAQRGDQNKAARILDRILDVQPMNREALLGRAALAIDQAEKSPEGPAREGAIERAEKLERVLRRAYERPTQKELELTGRLYYKKTGLRAEQKRYADASAAVRTAADAGIDFINKIDADPDPAMVALRGSDEYRAMLKKLDVDLLAAAREHLHGRLDRPLGFPFDFHVKGVDGEPLSLEGLRGKVVLVDIWGTWCQPCREAIPALASLHMKYERDGFAVVGLAFEKDAPDPESAARAVKAFVQQMGVPYRCGVGDESILEQIPDFHAFPTTIVFDRSGKPRLMFTENSPDVMNDLHAAIQILLTEPKPASAAGPSSKGSDNAAGPAPGPKPKSDAPRPRA